jgi:hypothetical protein
MKNKKNFYGFEFWIGRGTTTGEPNTDPGRYNGRLSIAGTPMLFDTQAERDRWVAADSKREAVTRKELRWLCRGLEKAAFEEMLQERA